jgi:CRISPR-associated exonuclease Cas4
VFAEDELLPISALQHLAFCERRCALIHVEGIWEENRLTAEGRVLHEKVHQAQGDLRGGVYTARGLRIRSLVLGLAGVADVVEFHRDEKGVPLPGRDGLWRPYPVEFKRGKPQPDICYQVQLCAQAICLEEMLQIEVPAGAVFYGQPRRRQDVEFSSGLRNDVAELAARLRVLVNGGVTPPAVWMRKCSSCSLVELCRPKTAGAGKSARRYLGQMLSNEEDQAD